MNALELSTVLGKKIPLHSAVAVQAYIIVGDNLPTMSPHKTSKTRCFKLNSNPIAETKLRD